MIEQRTSDRMEGWTDGRKDRWKKRGIVAPRLWDFTVRKENKNKAGCTAQDAPSMRAKITRDLRTYGRTDGRTRPHIEMLRRI